jgi:cbb3-type cytochrome oxidase subunit 3
MTLDINILRGIATLLLFLGFAVLVFYVTRPKNKQRLESHAAIPLESDDSIAVNERTS